jgi:dTDP-4-amino-4,6-dideoxygalactose transaminase
VTTPTAIPLVDLAWQHDRVANAISEGLTRTFTASAYILGPDVDAFEHEFADFIGTRHCIGVANGTDAIELALRAAGIGPGCEVVVPANTFVGTAEAVLRCGAALVLADCDPDHLLLDPAEVEARITPRTRAIIPVHLYGQMAPLAAWQGLASGDVVVVEDAAQAQGARQDGAGVGTTGRAAATSFYPGKNLGAYGDAGAVLTNDDDLAAAVRRVSNHGLERGEHRAVGVNSRLDTVQAVVLRAKLRHLATWNADRQVAARRYDALLDDLDAVVRPRTAPGNEHVWHLYVVRVPARDEVLAALHAEGIHAGVHYTRPVHLQPGLCGLGAEGSFPVAEDASRRVLSLPIYPGITEAQQSRVCEVLRRAVARHGA